MTSKQGNTLQRLSKHWKKSALTHQKGMNLPELGITIAFVSVLAAMGAPLMSMKTGALNDSMNLIEGNFKLARSKAMSQTTAFRIKPDGSGRFIMESHAPDAGQNIYSCADADINNHNGKKVWKDAFGFNKKEDMALLDGVKVKSITINGTALSNLTDWNLCFDARGMANKNVVLVLEETGSGNTKTLEVFSGGSLIAYDSARYNVGASSPDGDNKTSDDDDTSKMKCNKGGGNGSEGCDPGNNPDLGNDDENGATFSDAQKDALALLENESKCTVFTFEGINVKVCKDRGQKAVIAFAAGDRTAVYAFQNESDCAKDFTSDACSAIYQARGTI